MNASGTRVDPSAQLAHVSAPLYLLLFLPGFIAHAIVGLWYLYRCIRGWLRFTEGKPPF